MTSIQNRIDQLSETKKALLLKALEEASGKAPIKAEQAAIPSFKSSEPLTVEKKPLMTLMLCENHPPIDSAVLTYVPNSVLSIDDDTARQTLKEFWFNQLPRIFSLYYSDLGTLAMVTLPLFEFELFQNPDLKMKQIHYGINMVRRLGAGTVTLAGLLPATTNYGLDIRLDDETKKEINVSTGHATTTASVYLIMQEMLAQAHRNMANETLAFVGMGSIGTCTLKLLLDLCETPPRQVILSDIPYMQSHLQACRDQIVSKWPFCDVQLLYAEQSVPDALYRATFIVGATNQSNVLDIKRLKPGTLLVDDSFPHCFDVAEGRKRMAEDKDILIAEGGMLRSPKTIIERRYQYPELPSISVHMPEIFSGRGHDEITSCFLSGLLTETNPALKATVGLHNSEDSFKHLEYLQYLGYKSSDIRLDGISIDKKIIEQVRVNFSTLPLR